MPNRIVAIDTNVKNKYGCQFYHIDNSDPIFSKPLYGT